MFRRNIFAAFVLTLSFLPAMPAGAVEPDEILADAALEARAQKISRELRCVVCQSQSIDESNAPLAKDMRILVRERLVAGDTDEEVFAYLVDRYGDYVLLKPPVQKNTVLLWSAPFVVFVAAAAGAGVYLAHMRKVSAEAKNKQDPN
ncbi:MAG: cytochrome c-type biogenesis protein [Pseudomonadota bacterium]